MRGGGRAAALLACVAVVAALPVGAASAAHVARLDVRPVQVAPGAEVTVSGPPGWAPVPVTVHWNALGGEILGTFETSAGANASFGPATITIPDVPAGTYTLVADQDVPENHPQVRGVPARARIVVLAPGLVVPPAQLDATPPIRGREAPQREDTTSAPTLFTVGAGVFAATLAAGILPGWVVRRRARRTAA